MPLVAPALVGTSPIYVLVFYVAFRRLPGDASTTRAGSRGDGAVPDLAPDQRLPLVRPVAVAVGLLAFVLSWGNFLDPLVYLHDRDLFTLPLALRSLAQLDPTNYPLLLAGAVIATAPVLAVFLVAERWFLHEHHGGEVVGPMSRGGSGCSGSPRRTTACPPSARSTSRWPTASCSSCWGRRDAASRRCSGSSPGWRRRAPAESRSASGT